ncbi:MAG: hypothetical protein MR210_03875 [Erysipelotrichaceae bacterium]|nr:hypothetical protein [Erysipelotrichaceae bacterium]MDY5251254.1 hypothetical protein [Erysipelotrichaceae bacterium]
MNSEKDVYALFDEMFEQLEQDDPQLEATSAQKFAALIDERLEEYAQKCGYDDYNAMVDKEVVNEAYWQALSKIKAQDQQDYLIKALKMRKQDEHSRRYLALLANEDVEKVIAQAKLEQQQAPHSTLKFLLDAANFYQK